jgi:hypothetical protein
MNGRLLSVVLLTVALILGTAQIHAQQQPATPAQDNTTTWTCPVTQQAGGRSMMCRGRMRCGMSGGMGPNCSMRTQISPGTAPSAQASPAPAPLGN